MSESLKRGPTSPKINAKCRKKSEWNWDFQKDTVSKAHDCIPSQAFGKVSGMSKGMVPPNCTGNFMVLLSMGPGWGVWALMLLTDTVCDVASRGPFESSLGPVLYGSLGKLFDSQTPFCWDVIWCLGSYRLLLVVTICHHHRWLPSFCYPLFSSVNVQIISSLKISLGCLNLSRVP